MNENTSIGLEMIKIGPMPEIPNKLSNNGPSGHPESTAKSSAQNRPHNTKKRPKNKVTNCNNPYFLMMD